MFESRHRFYRRLCSVVSTTSSRNDYAIKLFTILKRNDPNYSKRTWLKNEHGKCMVSTKYAKKISFQPQIIPNCILYQPLNDSMQIIWEFSQRIANYSCLFLYISLWYAPFLQLQFCNRRWEHDNAQWNITGKYPAHLRQ